jgi:DNA-binding transcriptional LysR family regulator
MYERNLKGIDLNLLVVFAIVMREGSTIAAAQRLCLTQSAISQSLRRLRLAIDDELFVRDGKGIAPTPRALALYRLISPSLRSIGDAIRESDFFDPTTSTRRFRVRLKTTLSSCIASELMKRVKNVAPGIGVHFSSGNCNVGAILDRDECDIAISIEGISLQPWHREHKFEDVPLVAVFDGKRLGIKTPISRQSYLDLPHLVSPMALVGESTIELMLLKYNIVRPKTIITNDYAAYPLFLKKIDAIANCPVHLARSFAEITDLTVSPLPFDETAYHRYGMVWHARNDHDAGHAWLRDLCIQVVADLDKTSSQTKRRALA